MSVNAVNSKFIASSSSTVQVTEKVLASCRPAKLFDYHQGATISSLDFDDSGQYLISSGIDKSIQLYDCHKGVHKGDIQSQKYGAHSARFTHSDLNCLYASTPTEPQENEHAIRYLSLSNNQYLRYFKGHKRQVSSIEVNPIHDTFISSSFDGTVKLWDLKSSSPTGNIEVGQNSVVGFDPQGVVFAIGKYPGAESSTGILSIYDLKSFDKGPFLQVEIPTLQGQLWNSIEFSNNGKHILISTDSCQHYIVDSFSGHVQAIIQLASPTPNKWMSFKYPYTGCCTFSPCGKFVLAGSPKSVVHIFDISNLKSAKGAPTDPVILTNSITKLNSTTGIPKILAFNPKLLTFATADTTVTLWSPSG
ncbi:member of Set1p complex, histone methyl transferase [Spathaspora passalidarum NRRL Y-27907]|uniref:Member of Set1p complex, histone methyl transferase n=1 Tax=Spathaspora passalidarum (strain NRRL Y-27907 / 11-Y1) TaxID=619300 RepID=G3AG73_SPAPN|nr:member of Set1p complex, histone methyl transferase [Spathaspora passalidarum NRRL Y-27907]EGW35212.1 member of Set1p complex, histone methyl transferase [Spathaspora passalidarum NRRL Y-27907]